MSEEERRMIDGDFDLKILRLFMRVYSLIDLSRMAIKKRGANSPFRLSFVLG